MSPFFPAGVPQPDVVAREHPAADIVQRPTLPARRRPKRGRAERSADPGIDDHIVLDGRTRKNRLVHAGIMGHEDAQDDGRLKVTQRRLGGHAPDRRARRRLGIGGLNRHTRGGQRACQHAGPGTDLENGTLARESA